MAGIVDPKSLPGCRVVPTNLRTATQIDCFNTPCTIRTRHCLVYSGGMLLGDFRDSEISVPAGRYHSLIIDPLDETVVTGASTGHGGSTAVRYICQRDGKDIHDLTIQASDWDSDGLLMQAVPLTRAVLLPGGMPSGANICSDEPFIKFDGVDVIEEGRRPGTWLNLDAGFAAPTDLYFLLFVFNLQLDLLDAHNRIVFAAGTGTVASPVPVLRAVVPIGPVTTPGEEHMRFVFGIEMKTQISVIHPCLIYPPFYAQQSGVGVTPNGSYQVYAAPLIQWQLTGAATPSINYKQRSL